MLPSQKLEHNIITGNSTTFFLAFRTWQNLGIAPNFKESPYCSSWLLELYVKAWELQINIGPQDYSVTKTVKFYT